MASYKSPGMCSEDEDFTRDQEQLRPQVGDDVEDEDCCAESGSFLALFASNKGGHLGVARYDEEDCSFEVLQLPHDQDCQGLSMLLQQVSLKSRQLPLAPQNSSMTALVLPVLDADWAPILLFGIVTECARQPKLGAHHVHISHV